VPSGLTAVLFASYAIFVALLAHFLLKDEPLTTGRVVGIVIGLVGLALVFHDRVTGARSWLGEAALIFTAAIQATSSVAIRRAGGRTHAVVLSCIGVGVAAIVMLTFSAALGEPLLARMTPKAAATIVYLAVFGSVIAFTLSIRLIQVMGSNSVAVQVYVTPVLALVWGRLVLGEVLGPGLWPGIACIVGGVWLASRPPAPQLAPASRGTS